MILTNGLKKQLHGIRKMKIGGEMSKQAPTKNTAKSNMGNKKI